MNTTSEVKQSKRGRKAKYDFASLQVNNSMVIANPVARYAAYAYAARNNIKFNTEIVNEGVKITRLS